ncbi:MAG: LysR family transcriptional regulator, partial [Alphaproteobacteria bacterium]
MNQIHFNTLDLNLLRVLSVMLEERSVTRTGARLGLTQSAVSHALTRLRDLLGDPLFVRDGRSMRPTTRAGELARGVQAALEQLQAAVTAGFDPKTTDRTFTVIAGGYVSATLMPGVVEQLRHEAPSAQLRVRAYSLDLGERLNSGQADIVIGDPRMVSQ